MNADFLTPECVAKLHARLSVWPVCSSIASHSSTDSAALAFWAEPAELCRPRDLASAHQKLLMEDVNICSGASHESPSLSRECSEHINISEAKGTSGPAVPVCENRGWEWMTLCAVAKQAHTHSHTQISLLLLTAGVCSLHLNPLFPFFLVAFWPGAAPWSGSTWTGQLGTTGALSQPNPLLPPAFSIPWPLCCLWTCAAWYWGKTPPPETSTVYPMLQIRTEWWD